MDTYQFSVHFTYYEYEKQYGCLSRLLESNEL
jgi:hypothetical protein